MPLELHPAIAAYFNASNAHDPKTLLAAFAPDAVVVDEQTERRGHEAIRQWEQEAHDKYHPLAEPRAVVDTGGEVVVTARVSGDFPGSPLDLAYTFRLVDGLVARLEIALA